jgi:hypothetical protein
MYKTPDWQFHTEEEGPFNPEYLGKDFSVLEDFTDEELAEELCRRSSLGKELG